MQRITSLIAFAALPLCGGAQTALYNSGIINISAAGQVYVAGDAANRSGATLQNDGLLTVTGAFSNDAAMATPASGTLRLNGNTAQTITGAADYFAKDVLVDNPAGITLATRLKVDGVLSFNNGVINANNAAYPVVFTANASISGVAVPSDASHVKGYVMKEGTGAFTFPTGNGAKYQPVDIALSVNSAGITARYYNADAGSASFGTGGASATPLLFYNTAEYWDLSPAGTASGTVTIHWDGYGNRGIGNTADLRVAHKSGGAWLNEGAASVSGTTGAGSVTSGSISTWSPFTLGSVSSASPLPIKLLSFTASALERANRISWKTATTESVSHFEVERSADGRVFTAIGTQLPDGNRTDYSFDDAQPLAGTAYYRLRLVESGTAAYSQTVSLTRTGSSGITLSIYPNPATSELHVEASAAGSISLKDVSGKTILSKAVNGSTTISLRGFPAGLFFATYESQGLT